MKSQRNQRKQSNLHLGNNETLAQLKVCQFIIRKKLLFWHFIMLVANFPKYFDDCADCAFHKFYADCVDCANCSFHNSFADSYFSRSKWLESLGTRTVTENL